MTPYLFELCRIRISHPCRIGIRRRRGEKTILCNNIECVRSIPIVFALGRNTEVPADFAQEDLIRHQKPELEMIGLSVQKSLRSIFGEFLAEACLRQSHHGCHLTFLKRIARKLIDLAILPLGAFLMLKLSSLLYWNLCKTYYTVFMKFTLKSEPLFGLF